MKIKMEEDPSAWDFQRNAIYDALVCIVNSKGPEEQSSRLQLEKSATCSSTGDIWYFDRKFL
jgi:hypothetical protein